MKKLMLTFSAALLLTFLGYTQTSHFSLIYDFEGTDFDYGVKAMVAANDSLYIISNTPDSRGKLFRIDGNGNGDTLIWLFDEVHKFPSSLVKYGNNLFGTTRFSVNHGGSIFRYSLEDHSFEYIKDFFTNEAQEVLIKYIKNDTIWLTSQWSTVDKGSICTINTDGTDFKKIYSDTDLEKGQNPIDFVVHEDKIYIACYNGGGIPHAVGDGTYESSGCFIRINSDGTGYEKLVIGGDEHQGTQPYSLVINQNKITGLFAHTRGETKMMGGQFFQCNLDGSSFRSLGVLGGRCITSMLSTDSLIYGTSAYEVFAVNPFDGEIRVFDNLLEEPDFGFDITANPVELNGCVYMSTLQGGPDLGGTILKWTNEDPELDSTYVKSGSVASTIDLNELFFDPEGDSLSFDIEYNSDSVEINLQNGVLTVLPKVGGVTEVKITANDGWQGYKTYAYSVSTPTAVEGIANNEADIRIYPNPVSDKLYVEAESMKDLSITIVDINGRVVIKKQLNETIAEIEMNITPGIYNVLITDRAGEMITKQKIIKQ
ncbi:T9SS type A sorting domain-containing protein [Draconibacterium sediminis]|uniref:T9SS type A sorting domain-containing protein n=1 Tax=Draconibacterium sediminis TaxID=1544798 RepID=UPI0026EC8AA1|nr:T9SS type A sorting domain-containing protein [Draconibacterium sediminis]